jgi:hypothetical protein
MIATSKDVEKIVRINYCWWFNWLNLIITWLLHLKLKQFTHYFTIITINKIDKTYPRRWMTEAINLTLWHLFIEVNYQFDIMKKNMVCIDIYLWDWKVTSRQPKFWHITVQEKRSKISWKALGFVQEFFFSRKPKFRDNRVWHNEIHLYYGDIFPLQK